jgi:exosortase E/protease (VPEID-CTERM system)
MVLLLAAELLHLGFPLIPNFSPALHGWWWPVVNHGRLLGEAILGGAFVTIFLSWQSFSTELRTGLLKGRLAGPNCWLAIHLLLVALIAGWLALGMTRGDFTHTTGMLWFLGGVLLLPATGLSWALALIPSAFWISWLHNSRTAIAAGLGAGLFTGMSNYLVQLIWPPLTYYTFILVRLILRGIGLAVITDPSTASLGTDRFAVNIAPQCCGLEGIALISAFIAAYLWFYRADYRFPRALLLLPFGIAIIWLFNAVRIAALVLIGQWSGVLAITGFHNVAGWIFFNLTAFGIVTASHHTGWLIRDDAPLVKEHADAPNPAVPYLAPLLLTIAAAMLTAPLANGFDAAYPLRVAVTAFALWWYRDRIATTLLSFSWPAAAIGVACFALWIWLSRSDHAANLTIGTHLRGLPPVLLGGWILFRLAGAIITVPLAEELAFRGYLQRKLIAPDFSAVPFDRFTWPSFVISSAAFGLLHQSWLAGIGAGMLFAAAVYRRGRLADAITAHAVANALLAAYVIITGSWSLWM